MRAVVGELGREHVKRRREKDDRTVRMTACASPADFAAPSLQALEVFGVRAALSDSRACVGQRAEPKEARSALCRALPGQVAHDAGGLADRAPASREEANDAAAESQTMLAHDRGVEGDVPGRLGRDPRAEVASDQDRPGRFNESAALAYSFGDGRVGLDLQYAWPGHATRDCEEDGWRGDSMS